MNTENTQPTLAVEVKEKTEINWPMGSVRFPILQETTKLFEMKNYITFTRIIKINFWKSNIFN